LVASGAATVFRDKESGHCVNRESRELHEPRKLSGEPKLLPHPQKPPTEFIYPKAVASLAVFMIFARKLNLFLSEIYG
jgi:hypothetical protein